MVAARIGIDSVLELEGGRRLGYVLYGDPEGFPVLSCHGGLVCRLDAAPVDGPARELGALVISPDRPGVGLSDRVPGRATIDWVRDAEALLAALEVDRFACLGWSLGGQYCAAVAARLAPRVTRAALIAACLPLDEPGRLAELNRLDRTLGRLSVRSQVLARGAFAGLKLTASRTETKEGLPPHSMREGLRNPGGMVDEYRAFVAPWGFGLGEVAVPTDVWQGDADDLVRPSWAAELVRRLPDGRLVALAGEDHMIGITRRADVIRRLLDPSAEVGASASTP